MEKVTYLTVAISILVSLAYLIFQRLTGDTSLLTKPKENPKINLLTKLIKRKKSDLSKHKDDRSEKDVEDYYNDSSDK